MFKRPNYTFMKLLDSRDPSQYNIAPLQSTQVPIPLPTRCAKIVLTKSQQLKDIFLKQDKYQ